MGSGKEQVGCRKAINRVCRAVVLGAGASGKAAARLLQSEGSDVHLFSAETEPLTAAALRAFKPDVAVVSPGFCLMHPWLELCRKYGVPLTAELELGWSRFRGRTLAVTGSNGKSTVVKWLAESLRQAGYRAEPAGNYGLPASAAVLDDPSLDWLVLEVSSFQLETVREFRAEGVVLLNLLPNHLDRHGTMEAYLQLKCRIFEKAREGDVLLYPEELADRIAPGLRQSGRSFGMGQKADWRFEEGAVFYRGRKRADFGGTTFDNPVTGPAAAAGCALLHGCGIPLVAAQRAAREFQPLEHRMQKMFAIRGVEFINDSKATNLAALCAAVRRVGKPVHLIAGGRAKEQDFISAKEVLEQSGVKVYLIGESAESMFSAWSESVSCRCCGILEEAVQAAWRAARSGEVVMLAPGCASFDQFDSFEERGRCFSRLAAELTGQEVEP